MSDNEINAKPKVVTLQPGGLNYREWEFRLKNVLGYHGLARICYKADGQEDVKKPRPGNAGKSQDDWDEKADQAIAIISTSLGSNASLIMACTEPAEALETIRILYSQATKHDLSTLMNQWVALAPEGDDVPAYIVKLDAIRSDLASLGCNYNEQMMVGQILERLREYDPNSVFGETYRNLDFKFQDDPDQVNLAYVQRFVSSAFHKINNAEKEASMSDKAFMAAAHKRGFVKQPMDGKRGGTQGAIRASTQQRSSYGANSSSLANNSGCRFCRSKDHWIKDCDHPEYDPKVWELHRQKAREKVSGDRKDDRGSMRNMEHKANVVIATSVVDEIEEIDAYVPGTHAKASRTAPSNVHTASSGPAISERLYRASITQGGSILDSGTTSTMFHSVEWFELSPNFKRVHIKIEVGNGEVIIAEGMGDVQVNVKLDDESLTTTLRGCLYVPDLKSNLISISRLDKANHTILFGDSTAKVMRRDKVIMCGKLQDNLYQVNIRPTKISEHVNLAVTGDVWHRRLGHYPPRKLSKLAEHVHGLKHDRIDRTERCESCVQGKLIRNSFSPSSTKAKAPMDAISVDLAGPSRVESIKGGKYFLIVVDHYSRFYWVDILKQKSDAFESIKRFTERYETQLNTRLKVIRSDGGGEFCGRKWTDWLDKKGIIHETTAPYTPEQNGIAERAVRTLKEGARTALIDSCLKPKYWAAAVKNFVYVRNRTITQVSKDKTPFELFFGKTPDVEHIRVFGCVAYAQVPAQHQSTWQPKARKCVMIGHAQDDTEPTKGYLLYDPYKRTTFKCATVDFWETQRWNDIPQLRAREDFMAPEVEEEDDDDWMAPGILINNEDEPQAPQIDQNPNADDENENADDQREEEEEPADPPIVERQLRRGERIRRSPGRWWERANKTIEHQPLDELLQKAYVMSQYNRNDKEFSVSRDAEIDSMYKHEVWDLTTLPQGRKAISCRWVDTIKDMPDGGTKKKSRLVIRGFLQKEGIDYQEIFAPTIKMESVRVILAITAKLDLELLQGDVSTAFLNGHLQEEVYMTQPPGYEDSTQPDKVCKLKRTLYGLHQSPREWYNEIKRRLERIGMINTSADHSIFVNVENNTITILGAYVDDFIIATNSPCQLKKIREYLSGCFDMKWTENPKVLLGIELSRDRSRGTISLSQARYANKILESFDMLDCKPAKSPLESLEPGLPEKDKRLPPNTNLRYLEAVGKINYLVRCTRPDLALSVSYLASFCSCYQNEHWDKVERTLRYIKDTMDTRITYSREGESHLEGYSDADWAHDRSDRRSSSAFVFTLAGGPISWMSKKQSIVAWSTTEAEYIALGLASREAIWLNKLVDEIGYAYLTEQGKATLPIRIHEDNQAAISLAKNPVNHSRTKHIDIAHHGIRQYINDNSIELSYLNTTDMIADGLTKPLPGRRLKELCEKMNMRFLSPA